MEAEGRNDGPSDAHHVGCKKLVNEYLFTVTGVKTMKWFLSLTRYHLELSFQPKTVFGQKS